MNAVDFASSALDANAGPIGRLGSVVVDVVEIDVLRIAELMWLEDLRVPILVVHGFN